VRKFIENDILNFLKLQALRLIIVALLMILNKCFEKNSISPELNQSLKV
jgi:hypothetical protein